MASVAALGFSIISRYSGGGVRQARTDLAALRAQMATLNDDLGKNTKFLNAIPERWKAIGVAVASVTPALIPIGAAALQASGALLALAASVGSALGAYGAAMKGAITQTLEMAKAGKALSPVQKEFVGAVNSMKGAWQQFIKDTSNQTLSVATNVVQGLAAGIKLLKPLIDAVHPSLLQVSKDFESWMKGDMAKEYSGILAGIAKTSMPLLVKAGKDVLNVLGDGFRAFAPLANNVAQAIANGAAKLRAWSDNGGFQNFLSYVKENAPAVRAFFDAFGAALTNLFNIFKSMSATGLSVLTDALRGIAALDPGAVKAMASSFLLLKSPLAWLVLNCPPLRQLIIDILGAMNAQTVYALAAAFTAWRVSIMLVNAGLISTPVGWIIAALAGLAVAIVFIATKTTWFQTAWQYTWNFIKTVGETIWNGLVAGWNAFVNAMVVAWQTVSGALVTAWNAVWMGISTAVQAIWTGLTTAWNAVVYGLSTAWTTVSQALVTAWNAVWTGLSTAAQAIWTGLQTAWNAVVTAFSTVWTTVSGALTAAWNAVWTALSTAAQTVWTAMQTAWNAFITGLQTIWSTVSGALTAAWNAVWSALSTAAQAVWSAMQAAWNAFLTAVQSIWSTVSGALTAAWNTVWNALSTAARTIWTALQTAWQTFLTAVQTIWTTVSTALSAAWNAVWNAVKTAAQTIWTAMQTAWQAFGNAINTIWTTVSNTLKAAWSAVWNAIKTAGETIWNAIKAAWQAIGNAINDIWNKAGDALKKAWDAVWNTLKDTAGKVWEGIKKVVSDGINGLLSPINGLIKGFNAIAKAVSLDISIPEIHVNFAAGGMVGDMPHFAAGGTVNFSHGGGVLNGYAPGRDTVPAMLSRGEGVLVPEAVRGLGGSKFVHWANSHFSNGRGGKRVQGGNPFGSGLGGREHHAGGGVAGVQAWRRDNQGWHAAVGGILPTEIPVPGGGTAGQTPGDNVNKPQGSVGGAIANAVSDIPIPDPGDILKSILGLGGGVANLVLGFIGKEALDKALLPLIDKIAPHFGPVGEILGGAAKKLGHGMLDFLIKKDAEKKKEYEAMAVAGAQSVQAWAPLVMQALQLTGAPASWLGPLLSLMQAESSGNPNAINTTDINAKNGIPSQGLMQIIPPNFVKYHQAGTSNNILDPLANIAAAINYIKAVYGYVPGSPYANGTASATAGLHLVGENGPELVGLDGPAYAAFSGGQTVLPAGPTASLMGGGMTPPMPDIAGMVQGALTSGGSPDDILAQFQQIIQAAQEMATQVQTSWTTVTGSGQTAQSAMDPVVSDIVAKHQTEIPTAMQAMTTANTTAWTQMSTDTTTQWTAMGAAAFTPMNEMMATTVPGAATTMSTGVTGATTQMQTGVQGSWDAIDQGTQTTWTNVSSSITTSVDTATVPINGLLGGFNNVSSALGMGISVPLIAYEAGGVATFSTGGMLAKNGGAVPGYSPGRDTFPAMLSPGEGVLTPEAVRGLGGPGFVYAANRKFSGHRGGGGSTSEKLSKYIDSKSECGHYATGGMSGILGSDGRFHFASGTITAQDAEGLAAAGVSTSSVVQGSFNSSVAASGSTHSGDGVVDLSDLGAVQRLRDAGWAAWERTPAEGFEYHVHAVYMKATGVDPSAMGQEISFINGGTGLPAGSASTAETNKWGLNLGKWDFGPLVKSIIDGAVTTVPPMLKPLVKKHITKDQVASGFSTLKAALDGTDMGAGLLGQDLTGLGNSTYNGVVNAAASGATSFDQGGLLQPGYTLAFNGTGKPEPVGHDLVPRGAGVGDVNLTVHVHGNADAEQIKQTMDNDVLPKLRVLLQKGTGK